MGVRRLLIESQQAPTIAFGAVGDLPNHSISARRFWLPSAV